MDPGAPSDGRDHPHEPAEKGLSRELRALLQTYVSYLSGCDACVIESLRAARSVDAGPVRLRFLLSWRRAPFRTYTDREHLALMWAEVVAITGEGGVGDALRRRASELFSAQELTDLTRTIVTARGWRRLAMEHTGRTLPDRPARRRRTVRCNGPESCDLPAVS